MTSDHLPTYSRDFVVFLVYINYRHFSNSRPLLLFLATFHIWELGKCLGTGK